MSHTVCEKCFPSVTHWFLPEGTALPQHTKSMLQLREELDKLRPEDFPLPVLQPEASRKALMEEARYELESGSCDPYECDPGNRNGSAMMLAMLLPKRFGVPDALPLKCFGYPAPDALLVISAKARPKSSRGPDNRRQNVWEACEKFWFDKPHLQHVRELLQSTVCQVAFALDCEDPDHKVPVSRIIRKTLQTEVTQALGRAPRGTTGNFF